MCLCTTVGLDNDVVIGLLGKEPVALNTQSHEVAKKLQASETVMDCAQQMSRRWTLERLELTENMLVIESVERNISPNSRRAYVEEMFKHLEALGDAVIIALDLKAPGARCPLCEGAELVSGLGHLIESVCRNCYGRLLNPSGVQRLFGEERGMGPGELKASLSEARGLTCPTCHSKMGPLLVGERMIDLCPRCGSMWMDKGELSLTSGGRYDEIPGPIGDTD